jgi:hypothetical protein
MQTDRVTGRETGFSINAFLSASAESATAQVFIYLTGIQTIFKTLLE